jgi:hypothetical protein
MFGLAIGVLGLSVNLMQLPKDNLPKSEVVLAVLSGHKELFSLITIVKMIIAHAQAQSQRKLQYVAKSA